MTKIKNVNKFLYILLAFLIAAVAIVLPLTLHKKDNQVYADSVETMFVGSDVLVPVYWRFANGTLSTDVCTLNFRVELGTVTGSTHNTIYLRFFDTWHLYVQNGNTLYDSDNVFQPDSLSNPLPSTWLNLQTAYATGYYFAYNSNSSLSSFLGFTCYVTTDSLYFNSSLIDRVSQYYESIDSSKGYYVIRYIDSNGNSLYFKWFTKNTGIEDFVTRTYFLTRTVVESTQYQTGYTDGRDYGYQEGYSAGQSTGYDNGYTAGDAAGYIRGVNATNQYTFTNLISATIDAPIAALTGLLNFEILGVNLSAFVYGLFTITLVIVVIKYIKGGK